MSAPENHLGLLIIDLQDRFLRVIPDQESLIQRTVFALKAAKLLGIQVAATEQMPEKLGPTAKAITEIWPESTPVFDKSCFSALSAEGIGRWIESNQIDHLLLAGIETPICVYQTAVEALGSDLGVTLLSDCIGERRRQDHDSICQQLLAMGAHILPSETIFYSLLGSCENPKFKAFTELVKKAGEY